MGSEMCIRDRYNDNHSSRDMRASLIRGNLVIVTVNIDIDDNTGLVRFFHGIHLLVIIGPQDEGTSRPPTTRRYCSLIS